MYICLVWNYINIVYNNIYDIFERIRLKIKENVYFRLL